MNSIVSFSESRGRRPEITFALACGVSFLIFASVLSARAAAASASAGPGSKSLSQYFQSETKALAESCLSGLETAEDWQERRAVLREQLFEMLSLSPMPEKTDLKAVIAGKLDQDEFSVERLHFQSMPGLYVTANLYLPKQMDRPAPAVLYVCGHAYAMTNGVSLGNKTAYQHHGAWFARNGYVCLVLDTVQLGEIQGVHHGTYREGMWWWNSRGYSSAGVEAWNCIRALDYLQSRPEVDGARIGVTGRSGGGAYSWWISALDDRIKAAAPVAGITDLQNHVVDGTVEGHCDCMFMVNTYRWDYPAVAALVAPRPLLICNSDKDSIFPLDGVERLHAKVAKVYQLLGATNHLGLLITDGPHKDTQDLQLPVFRWFNRFLKGEDPVIEMAAKPFFAPRDLKVFETLPPDERTSRIQDSFVPRGLAASPPEDEAQWSRSRSSWKAALAEKVFRGWPKGATSAPAVLRIQERHAGKRLDIYEFNSQANVPLRLYVFHPRTNGNATSLRLRIADEGSWGRWLSGMKAEFSSALIDELRAAPPDAATDSAIENGNETAGVQVCFAPRGVGLSAWGTDPRTLIQIRRRFMLLGQTVDSMRVWDITRAVQVLKSLPELNNVSIELDAEGMMGVNAVYAAIFEPQISRLTLAHIPSSHDEGPDYLNVLRFLDLPQAVALAAEKSRVVLVDSPAPKWHFVERTAANLHWAKGQFELSSAR